MCVPGTESDGLLRRPILTDIVVTAIRRYVAGIDGDDFRPDLASEALRLAEVLDADRAGGRLHHRATIAELVGVLDQLARARIMQRILGCR